MIKKQMAILILTMFISSQIIIGNSMAENTNEILIESDVTWTEDQYIDGNIRILNGGKLTIIDSEISFSTESKLIIDEGGFVVLEDSTFTSESIPTDLVGYGYCDDFNRSTITVDISSYDNDFEIIIDSSSGTNFNGATAYIGCLLYTSPSPRDRG